VDNCSAGGYIHGAAHHVTCSIMQALVDGYSDADAVQKAGTRVSRSVPSTLVVSLSDYYDMC